MSGPSYLRIIEQVIGALGILGNSLVCVVIAKVPAMRTLTNAFIFNQAVVDFLASVMLILHSNFETPSPLDQNQIVAILQCYVWDQSLILWILFVASTFNLVLLTSERYMAIVHPFKYLTHFSKKRSAIMLTGVWVLAAGYKCSNVIFRQIVEGVCELRVLSTAVSIPVGFATFVLEYLIPLIFMTFCYIHIILQLRKAASTIRAEPTTTQGSENSMSGSLLRAKRNTLKTLFIVFVTYTIYWSPNQISFFMFNLGLSWNVDGAFYYVSQVLLYLNCCVNPIIYSFKYKQFQRSLQVLLKPCFPKLAARANDEMIAIMTPGAQRINQHQAVSRTTTLSSGRSCRISSLQKPEFKR